MSSISLSQPHLNDSIRGVDPSSWLIANTLLLTHSPSPLPGKIQTNQTCWSDSYGGHFALSSAPNPLPDSKPLAEDSSSITRVHAVDNQAAVWRAGEAFIKAHRMDYPDVTREHVTLQFLKDQQPQGFEFPNALYHFETGSRYYIITSRVPGQLLDEAWPSLDETLRQFYIGKIADICSCLASWRGDIISGVDGRQLSERYLAKFNSKTADALSPQQLMNNCTEISMDISTLVFYHCDLGPTNILVDVSTGSLGIIDWEIAGYVPIEWIRTKFRLSAGMDLSQGDDDDSRRDWRRKVAQHLGKLGYNDVVEAWWKFQHAERLN